MPAPDTLAASWLTTEHGPTILTGISERRLGAVVGSGCVALNSEVHQGHFAEGVVSALACAAGLNPGKRSLDVEGVDIQISFPGRANTTRYPLIEAQVKSCRNPTYVGESFSYSISAKNYNDLIGQVGDDLAVPRYLFLVHVPQSESDYVTASSDGMIFRYAVYWANLMDQIPIDPAVQASKTVHVPRANLLTPDSLIALVKGEIGEGGN